MSKEQKLALIVSILASFVAFLDGSVVNVALPSIIKELGGGLAAQQWIVDSYLITLGALILVAGSLSDLLGRKKVLSVGLWGFAISSLLCAIAPNGLFLIICRALQGIAGALLVPSSLALIISYFSKEAQSKAIGTWTAWTGISFIIGPLTGGLLVDLLSWRYIFAINIIPICITLVLLYKLDIRNEKRQKVVLDVKGAILCTVGLGAPVYAFIETGRYGFRSANFYVATLVGLAAIYLFLRHERQVKQPMLPLSLFASRNFSVGNIATMAVYAGLSVATFLITLFIQQVNGYSATEAGIALLPITIIMFFLSPRFGTLSARYGPRFFMASGPIFGALGFLYLLRLDAHVFYWTDLFPGLLIFGVGLSATVAPLTSAVLSSISSKQAGIASAVNNAVARIAGLIAIAVVGLVIGTRLDVLAFHKSMVMTACLLILGGTISAIGISNGRSTNQET